MSITRKNFKEEGFSIKDKKYYVNNEYDIILETIGDGRYINHSKVFIKTTCEIIYEYSDLLKLLTLSNFNKLCEDFKSGNISDECLNQGEAATFKKNIQKDFGTRFTKEQAYTLQKAFFNYLTSNALMCANSEPIYSYRILECEIEYVPGSVNVYNFIFKLKGGKHEFYKIFKFLNDIEYIYGLSHPSINILTEKDFSAFID